MVDLGLFVQGIPDNPLKRLDNGYVVPDASVEELTESHERNVENLVEVGAKAEAFGYDYFVAAEHHSSLASTLLPNPLQIQAAVARETDEIRLLQMANILPWHEPVRLAEQTATLDVLSDGRAEVGVGQGDTGLGGETLGQYWGGTANDRLRNRKSFEEKLDILRRAWTENFLDYTGEFHRIPPSYAEWTSRQEYFYFADEASEYDPDDYFRLDGDTTTLKSLPVLPKPKQDPHPQLWKPGMSARSIEWAARQGMNVCTHCADFENVAKRVETYHEAAAEAGWPDHRPEHDGDPFDRGWDARRGRGVVPVVSAFNTEVASDETREKWRRGFEMGLSRREDDAEIDLDVDEFVAESDTPIVGDSAEIAARLRELASRCGYEDFAVVLHAEAFGLDHEAHLEQAEAFAERVVPRLEERL